MARLHGLLTLRPASRPWQLAVLAAAAVGVAMAGGAIAGNIPAGTNAALGAFAFCALPPGSPRRQFAVVGAMGLGIIAGFVLGTIVAPSGPMAAIGLGLFAAGAVAAVLRGRVGMPGALFPCMSAALATQIALPLAALPQVMLQLGSGVALALAMVGLFRAVAPDLSAPAATPLAWVERSGAVPVVVGLAVAASHALAHLAGVPRPYWAPVSCIAVIQGMSFAAVKTRYAHRVAGTLLGLVPAALLLPLAPHPWLVALAITLLSWGVEALVPRHYGLAVMLITPLALLLAQAAHRGPLALETLLLARALDTVIGSAVALLAGFALVRLDRSRA